MSNTAIECFRLIRSLPKIRMKLIGSPLLFVLAALLAVAILSFLGMMIYASFFRIDKRDIPHDKAVSSGSSGKSTPVIGFFSDSHGMGCRISPDKIAETFIAAGCDAVLFGGDCVFSHKVRPSDFHLLTQVSSLLKEKGIPVYAVYGNHDTRLSPEDFARMGVILLQDSWQVIHIRGSEFALCGLSDSGRNKRSWPDLPSDFIKYPGFRLLLVHNPDYVYHLPDCSSDPSTRPCDYLLAGHLHGGQIHLPFGLEFHLLRMDRIATSAKIYGGPFTMRGISGFISNGIGCGSLPIRFFARAEIHILKLHI